MIHLMFVCKHDHKMNPCSREPQQFEAWAKPYQVPVFALWFHAHHEGHKFDYYEDGKLILDAGQGRAT